MKTTIRRGVFETNSSSVHTLTIQKKKVNFNNLKGFIKKEIEDGLTFGKYNSTYDAYQDKNITPKLREFREKLDELWRAICSDETGFLPIDEDGQ